MKRFSVRYASLLNQSKVPSRLYALSVEDVRDEDDDNPLALKKLISRINELDLLVKPKDRDDEAKVCFLTQAFIGTNCDLCAGWRPAERGVVSGSD